MRKRVDEHLEETDNNSVRDGGDELAKFCVACHRTVVLILQIYTATHGVLSFFDRCLTLHLCALTFSLTLFLFSSLTKRLTRSTPRTKTTRPLMACRAQRIAKSNQTNCNRPNTTRAPRVHHVFSACSPRVSHVYHVFTTCLPRVHHVFITCRTWSGGPSNREGTLTLPG